jgi:hypothetical protein
MKKYPTERDDVTDRNYLEMLNILASGSSHERAELACSIKYLPYDIQAAIVRDDDETVRAAAATKGDCLSPNLIKILAKDPVWWVRHELALCGYNTFAFSKEVIDTLAKDEERNVRYLAKKTLAGQFGIDVFSLPGYQTNVPFANLE